MGTEGVKYIDIEEFRETGYLQELNRNFLHPLGLALEIIPRGWNRGDVEELMKERGSDMTAIEPIMEFIEAVGLDKPHLGGVWDYRDDAEGMNYGGLESYGLDTDKADRVAAEWDEKAKARHELLGYVVQPVRDES